MSIGKFGFRIHFYKIHSCLENILKSSCHLSVIKSFLFWKTPFQFSRFLEKSNKYKFILKLIKSGVFEFHPLTRVQWCFPCVQIYSRSPISKSPHSGQNRPSCENFTRQSKQWFNSKIILYLSTGVQGYAHFLKRSLESQVIVISWKLRQMSLPRKMRFLTDAHFEIMRLPLHSWHWNESVGSLDLEFQAPVGLARKTMQP